MKTIGLFIILLTGMMWGCRDVSKHDNTFKMESFVLNVLKNEDVGLEKKLVLFIAEGMCSECINKEFMNLKEQKDMQDHLVVIGMFSNKRLFMACVNSLNLKNKAVFYDSKLLASQAGIPQNPIYMVYDRKQGIVSDVFTPQPCRIPLTLEYFKNIKNSLVRTNE